MAFVFRSEKPQQQSKPNPNVGPGIYTHIQPLTISKFIIKIKYPKPMFPSAAWNPNSDKILITWPAW